MVNAAVLERSAGSPEVGRAQQRILDPLSRISEILFGVILVLTFTTTIDAASGGVEEVRTLFVVAVGCTLAWGVVDAIMFLMRALTERGRGLLTVRAVRGAATPAEAQRIIAGALPPVLAGVLEAGDLERMHRRLQAMDDLPVRPRLGRQDWVGTVAVFLLVVLSTLPIAVPFLVIGNVHLALRVSNAVAIAMLFGCGYALARYGGYPPWLTGLSLVVVGVVLVAITVAFGG